MDGRVRWGVIVIGLYAIGAYIGAWIIKANNQHDPVADQLSSAEDAAFQRAEYKQFHENGPTYDHDPDYRAAMAAWTARVDSHVDEATYRDVAEKLGILILMVYIIGAVAVSKTKAQPPAAQ